MEDKMSEVLNVEAIFGENVFNLGTMRAVSYTHLTLPTIYSVKISVVAETIKKKKNEH